jgi:hypothetical protein
MGHPHSWRGGERLGQPPSLIHAGPDVAPIEECNSFQLDVGCRAAGHFALAFEGLIRARTSRGILLILATLSLSGLNAAMGQFKPAVYYHAGQLPRHVAAAQLTANGNVDLVFADYLSNQIVALLGNGDGTFQKPVKFPAPSPISLAIADFDEDGNQDVAVVQTSAGEGSIAIFLGDGAGHFKRSPAIGRG